MKPIQTKTSRTRLPNRKSRFTAGWQLPLLLALVLMSIAACEKDRSSEERATLEVVNNSGQTVRLEGEDPNSGWIFVANQGPGVIGTMSGPAGRGVRAKHPNGVVISTATLTNGTWVITDPAPAISAPGSKTGLDDDASTVLKRDPYSFSWSLVIGDDSAEEQWTATVTGEGFTLGLKSDGTLWGWGDNPRGQLGFGTFGGYVPSPIQIGTDTDWMAVAAGTDHTLALKTSGNGC